MNAGSEAAVSRAKLPTNDVILAVAVDLFSSGGYDGTSMRDIAAKVGVRPASIYNHFASKEDLLWAIVQSTMTDLLEQQRAVLSRPGTPREQLTRFVITHVKFHAFERFQRFDQAFAGQVVAGHFQRFDHDLGLGATEEGVERRFQAGRQRFVAFFGLR